MGYGLKRNWKISILGSSPDALLVIHQAVIGDNRNKATEVPLLGLHDKFIVPHQRNEHFTGRETLLASIFSKLSEISQRNGIVLGGIGKTQLALEYVYSQRNHHNLIYWISGVSQATLFDGFLETTKRTGCLSDYTTPSPSEVAKYVLYWLNR